MNIPTFYGRSLKTRVTLVTLVIFLVGLWSLAFYANRVLRANMEDQLSQQQRSAASLAADELDDELRSRIKALETVAAGMAASLPGNASALQNRLEQMPLLQMMFNGGAYVTLPDGKAVASVPLSAGRIGLNYLDQDHVAAALREGRPRVGQVRLGTALKAPVFGIAVPLRAAQGTVVGALVGVINLSQASFLDHLISTSYGRTGGYLLVAPTQRLIITASERQRVMESLPAPGVNPAIDRYLQGYEGSSVLVNPMGVPVLVTAKGIPAAGWYLVVSLPIEEALAPIQSTRMQMLRATLLLTLIAGGLIWWLLARELKPLLATSRALAAFAEADSGRALQPLPVTRHDEIGLLVGSFNRLLLELARRGELIGRHQAELEAQNEELRQDRQKLGAIFDAAGSGIAITGADGRFIEMNKWWTDRLGYAPEEIGKLTAQDITHPDDRQASREWIGKLMAGEVDSYQIEKRFVTKNASSFWAHLSASAIKEENGRTSRIVGVVTDISERRRSEEEIRQLSEAIRQTTESIVITDRAARIEYVNDAYLKNTGYSREELLGRNSRLLQSGKTPKATYDALWQALREGRSWSGEFYNQRKDGSEFVELAHISPVRDAAGKIGRYVAAKRDITQAKRIEAELLQAKMQAEAANSAKSQFLAAMSHEVRTPMNGILGMAQVLLAPGIKEAERLDYARTILASGQTLLRLLNDLLDLARIESGKLELEANEMLPEQIMGQTRSLFAQSARAKGLGIESDWSGPLARYLGDSHRLEQMLANLVGNAIKFTHQGTIRIEAREISCDADSATLEFAVSDSGIGIAQDKLALLFEAFSQVDGSTTRRYGGTGLGLSIVRTLARLMGGEVGVQSEPGVGSRFWFRIRAQRLAASPEQAEVSGAQGALPDTPGLIGSARVLLVEDNPDHRRLSRLLLERLGAHVTLANDGQQGLDAIVQGESAPIVLMDLHLPVLDGYAATQAIRQWERTSGQGRRAIIALTADAYEEDRLRCLQAGMDEVLTKPVSFESLRQVLVRWLPAAPAPASPSGPAWRTPDGAHLRALLGEIEPLLANNQFDAIARMRELQEAVADTELADAVEQAVKALQEFKFDVALSQLQKIPGHPAWQKA